MSEKISKADITNSGNNGNVSLLSIGFKFSIKKRVQDKQPKLAYLYKLLICLSKTLSNKRMTAYKIKKISINNAT